MPYRGECGPLGELARQAKIGLCCADHLTRHLAPRIRLLHGKFRCEWVAAMHAQRDEAQNYLSSNEVTIEPLTRAVMGGSPNVTLFELSRGRKSPHDDCNH